MKTKTSHTPGPWQCSLVHRGEDVSISATRKSGNPQWVARVYNSGILAEPDPELTANARLIAASPELYKACQLVLRDYKNGIEMGPTLAQIVRAAIEKAEGR